MISIASYSNLQNNNLIICGLIIIFNVVLISQVILRVNVVHLGSYPTADYSNQRSTHSILFPTYVNLNISAQPPVNHPPTQQRPPPYDSLPSMNYPDPYNAYPGPYGHGPPQYPPSQGYYPPQDPYQQPSYYGNSYPGEHRYPPG